ncbi:acyltransferase family protein [Chryseobacterium sp.]|uniref:acyltransferase family protein n=1 Tax=Chryseobacterium sp. TaxID=1871047 RepID=UPI002FCCB58D
MKLHNLQILRGISALLVCCFHLREGLILGDVKYGEILFGRGSIGVPIFFVISGFIMVFTTKKIKFDENISKEVISFFKKRIIRIVPLYYLLTFAWIILGGSILYYSEGLGLKRLIYSLLFLPLEDQFPVLYLGWSLNYEIFFYLIFGLSFLFKTKRYFFIIAFFVTSYILGVIFKFETAYLRMITSELNLYFISGILLGLYFNQFSVSKQVALPISVFGIFLFILMFFNIIQIKNEMILLVIVSLFVLAFLLFDYTFKSKGNKILIFLGDISYSLYLSHSFVEVFSKRIIPNEAFIVPYFILKIILVIVLSSVLYLFIEKKLTEYLKLKIKA